MSCPQLYFSFINLHLCRGFHFSGLNLRRVRSFRLHRTNQFLYIFFIILVRDSILYNLRMGKKNGLINLQWADIFHWQFDNF